ncbi:hypothetical protein GCM10023225_11480 [Kineococcus glutinatus]|uniref:Uncharacterized protein n=1 Tax=Kineococcus glutinatus TaxID=1070872 RepID=A0ABP9HHY9_9ACTN
MRRGTPPGLRTERGQVRAVAQACASFRAGDVALAVDARARNEWPQVLRVTCRVPAASVVVPTSAGAPGSAEATAVEVAAVRRAAARIRAAGGRPVLVAAEGSASLVRLGVPQAAVRRVAHVRTSEDERVLQERPDGAQAIAVELYAAPAPAS